ncbi:MAG TPA: TRAP transporter substrate-binding protein [Spirochaetia bacterium]|nr:TRAP transporter substrate-binding protein [Spirochaetia bacterium]
MKRLLLLLAFVGVAGMLFASGTKESTSTSQAPLVLRATNTLPADHPMTQALYKLAEGVKAGTNGKVVIQVFPNSSLGGNTNMVEGVQLGTVDICNQFAGTFDKYVPEIDFLAEPFLFSSENALYKALDGNAGQILAKALQAKGFVPLGYFYGGARSLMNNVRPINSPADLKGLKIRTISSKITLASINAMGAIAVPMDQADVYSALQQGVLDGWENSPTTLYTLKLYEVTKYVSWTRHFMTPDLFVLSAKTWAKLSPDEQKVMMAEAKKAVDFERQAWDSSESKIIEELKTNGVKFNDVSDLQAFRDRVKPLWDAYDAQYKNGLVQAVLDSQK